MKKILIILSSIIFASVVFIGSYFWHNQQVMAKSITENNGEYVVLLHGLGRTSLSMQKIGLELVKNNYRVININYPSKNNSIVNIAENNLKKELTDKYTDTDEKINFVTHSMGGIIVRYFLANNNLENINRIIMLAPPNQGSEMADKWSSYKIVTDTIGPALKEMATEDNSLVNVLPNLNFEIGVIAGEYDKKVSPEQTKLDNMTDFIIFPIGHTWIMNNNEVIEATLNFLTEGKFKK